MFTYIWKSWQLQLTRQTIITEVATLHRACSCPPTLYTYKKMDESTVQYMGGGNPRRVPPNQPLFNLSSWLTFCSTVSIHSKTTVFSKECKGGTALTTWSRLCFAPETWHLLAFTSASTIRCRILNSWSSVRPPVVKINNFFSLQICWMSFLSPRVGLDYGLNTRHQKRNLTNWYLNLINFEVASELGPTPADFGWEVQYILTLLRNKTTTTGWGVHRIRTLLTIKKQNQKTTNKRTKAVAMCFKTRELETQRCWGLKVSTRHLPNLLQTEQGN